MANSRVIHSHLASLHWPWSTNWRPAERPVSWFIASLSWKSLVAFLSALNTWLWWSSSSSGGAIQIPPSPEPPCLCLPSQLLPGLFILLAVSRPSLMVCPQSRWLRLFCETVREAPFMQGHWQALLLLLISQNQKWIEKSRFNNFSNDLDHGTESTLSKFEGSTHQEDWLIHQVIVVPCSGAGRMDWQDLHKVQQGEMQSPSLCEE